MLSSKNIWYERPYTKQIIYICYVILYPNLNMHNILTSYKYVRECLCKCWDDMSMSSHEIAKPQNFQRIKCTHFDHHLFGIVLRHSIFYPPLSVYLTYQSIYRPSIISIDLSSQHHFNRFIVPASFKSIYRPSIISIDLSSPHHLCWQTYLVHSQSKYQPSLTQ